MCQRYLISIIMHTLPGRGKGAGKKQQHYYYHHHLLHSDSSSSSIPYAMRILASPCGRGLLDIFRGGVADG
jgi:hypothetical protein